MRLDKKTRFAVACGCAMFAMALFAGCSKQGSSAGMDTGGSAAVNAALIGQGGMPESGLIISPDGYILTNNHVVTGAQQVIVVISGKGCDARVVGTDALTDIAVVKVTPPAGTSLPVAQFGNSDVVQVGDWAIAVGDPLDIGTTVTLGIISATRVGRWSTTQAR